MPRTFNRRNCTGCVRGEGRDLLGNKVIISGVHAFEYSVVIISGSLEQIRRFPNGKEARAFFARVTRKR